jgi:photosystem II stability/assembly factor-like uncharacterized protein
MKQTFTFCSLATLLLCGLVAPAQITPLPWSPIGPKGDFANPGDPGVNGRIRSIGIHDLGAGDYYIYAGAGAGGLWRSRASTPASWSNLGNKLSNPSIGALAVDPNNPDDILVGTGDWTRYGGEGMFHSLDAGLNWNKVLLSPAPGAFFRILYYPGIPDILLAATDVALFRTDHGPDDPLHPWIQVLSGAVTDLAVDPSNANIWYACTTARGFPGGGLYKSTDSGNTWFLTTGPYAPGNRVGRGSVSICRDFPNNLVYVYETNCMMADVLLSTDSGTTWSSIVANLFDYKGPWNFGSPNNQDCHAQAVAFKPNDPSKILIGAADLAMTSNKGLHWDALQTPKSPHQDYNQLYFSDVSGDDTVWLCNDGGIYSYRLGNGSAVSYNGNNQTGIQVSQISVMDAIRDLRVIGNQDDQTACSFDDGQTWQSTGCCDVYDVAITYDAPLFPLPPAAYWYLLDGRAYNRIFGGSIYDVSDFADGHSTNGLVRLFYNRFEDKVYSLSTRTGALVSRPASASTPSPWTQELALPPNTGGLTGDRLNGQTLFVWGAQPDVLTVLKKNGSGWSIARNATIGKNFSIITNTVQSVYASTEVPGESWARLATNNTTQVLHTTDDWQTWSDISGNLASFGPNVQFNSPPPGAGSIPQGLVVMPFNSKVIFLPTLTGVFCTQNGGQTWSGFPQTGLPRVLCSSLRYVTDAYHIGNDKIVVSTYGHGMYESTIPRPPMVYVDQRYPYSWEDGSFEHPLGTLNIGISTTPNGGMMALDGMTTYLVPAKLTKPMTITAYEAAAFLTK